MGEGCNLFTILPFGRDWPTWNFIFSRSKLNLLPQLPAPKDPELTHEKEKKLKGKTGCRKQANDDIDDIRAPRNRGRSSERNERTIERGSLCMYGHNAYWIRSTHSGSNITYSRDQGRRSCKRLSVSVNTLCEYNITHIYILCE